MSQVIYVEWQYDPEAEEVRLLATDYEGDQYRTSAPAANEDEAVAAILSFKKMYADLGCDVR